MPSAVEQQGPCSVVWGVGYIEGKVMELKVYFWSRLPDVPVWGGCMT